AQQEAQAQSGSALSFCFNDSTGQFAIPNNNSCATGFRIITAPRANLGFCILRDAGKYFATAPIMVDGKPKLNSSGTKCLDESGQEESDFKTFKQITDSTQPPTTPGTTPGTNP